MRHSSSGEDYSHRNCQAILRSYGTRRYITVFTTVRIWIMTSLQYYLERKSGEDSYLKHSYEVDVVTVQHLLDEADEFFFEFLFTLEPGGMEVKAKWCTV